MNLKNKGLANETIALKTGLTAGQVKFIYSKFLNESIENLVDRKSLAAQQATVYRKRLAEAEEQYETMKALSESGSPNARIALAAWHKIVVETADSYTSFLTKIGAINPDTYKEFQLEGEIKLDKNPIEILIEANRKKLMDELNKAKELENPEVKSDGTTPGESNTSTP